MDGQIDGVKLKSYMGFVVPHFTANSQLSTVMKERSARESQ
jgi:hypothetical protein